MSNLKEEVLEAIRNHGPFKSASLPAYLAMNVTTKDINKAVVELIYLERVSLTKGRLLTAK